MGHLLLELNLLAEGVELQLVLLDAPAQLGQRRPLDVVPVGVQHLVVERLESCRQKSYQNNLS